MVWGIYTLRSSCVLLMFVVRMVEVVSFFSSLWVLFTSIIGHNTETFEKKIFFVFLIHHRRRQLFFASFSSSFIRTCVSAALLWMIRFVIIFRLELCSAHTTHSHQRLSTCSFLLFFFQNPSRWWYPTTLKWTGWYVNWLRIGFGSTHRTYERFNVLPTKLRFFSQSSFMCLLGAQAHCSSSIDNNNIKRQNSFCLFIIHFEMFKCVCNAHVIFRVYSIHKNKFVYVTADARTLWSNTLWYWIKSRKRSNNNKLLQFLFL